MSFKDIPLLRYYKTYKNNVVKAINRIVPSDKSIGPYIVELYLSVHCSRTVLEELTLK